MWGAELKDLIAVGGDAAFWVLKVIPANPACNARLLCFTHVLICIYIYRMYNYMTKIVMYVFFSCAGACRCTGLLLDHQNLLSPLSPPPQGMQAPLDLQCKQSYQGTCALQTPEQTDTESTILVHVDPEYPHTDWIRRVF